VITTEKRIKIPESTFRAPGHNNPFVSAGLFEGNKILKTIDTKRNGGVPACDVEKINQVLRAGAVNSYRNIGSFCRPGVLEDEGAFNTGAIGRAYPQAVINAAGKIEGRR
jgi:hypothetical protein